MNIYSGKNRLIIRIISLVILLLVVTTIIMSLINPRPPLHQVAKARKALAEARQQKAHLYYPEKYFEAEKLYDSVMLEWMNQNDRFFLQRDFSKVSLYTDRLIERANEAKELSITNISGLQVLLPGELQSLQSSIQEFDSIIRSVPLSKNLAEKYTKGRLLFLESKAAYENKSYKVAYDKFLIARQLCTDVFKDFRQLLDDYFVSYNQWIELADATITRTRKIKSSALIVDKFAKTCMLYQNGKLTYTYEIELGPNWIGDKRYKGDNATPEGKYTIIKRLSAGETKYHKALLLNYPNEEDRKRFIEGIKNGTLPESSDIGGLIEIHGEGGKGFQWTNGCIALKNEDMDRLYPFAPAGTPVIVVGSLKKLPELFKFYDDGL